MYNVALIDVHIIGRLPNKTMSGFSSLADALLVQFCKRTKRMYGSSIITPNMHLHCRLKFFLLTVLRHKHSRTIETSVMLQYNKRH